MDATKTAPVSGGKVGGNSPLDLARAARKPRDPSLPKLTEIESFTIQAIRNAQKACKMLAKAVRSGRDVSPEAVDACATLVGAAARSLAKRV